MSTLAVSSITDASGGSTAQINGATPTVYNTMGRNRIINGDMRIDQRNAGASVSLSTSVAFAVDRYGANTNVGSGHTIQQVSDGPAGFKNSVKITVSTAGTASGSSFGRFTQAIEGYNFADLEFATANAKTVTISFWVKSSLTGNFGVALRAGGGNLSYVSQYTINAANTWEYKSVTVPGSTTGTWPTDNNAGAYVGFDIGEGPDRSLSAGSWATPVGASAYGLSGGVKLCENAGATWQVTGVQLEVGSVATEFERRPYGTELALCQRYYWQNSGRTTALSNLATGANGTFIMYQQAMRAAPTLSSPSTTNFTASNIRDNCCWVQASTTTYLEQLFINAEL